MAEILMGNSKKKGCGLTYGCERGNIHIFIIPECYALF